MGTEAQKPFCKNAFMFALNLILLFAALLALVPAIGMASGLTASGGSGIVTVTSPGVFEITFDQTRSGGITRWYDLKNDPGKTLNLARSGGMPYWEYFWPGGSAVSYQTSGILSVLENNSARTKVSTAMTLNGLPFRSTFTVYPAGLITEEYVLTNNIGNDVVFSDARYGLLMNSSLSFDTLDDQDTPLYNPPVFGTDTWQQLTGVSTPLFSVVKHFLYSDFFHYNNVGYFRDNDGFTLPAGAADRVIFYTTLSPDATALSNKTIIRTYETDFRNPAALAFAVGYAKTDDPADLNHDGYIENEAGYAMTAFSNAIEFSLDGSAVVRHSPVFKIYNYTENAVRFAKDGASLVKGADFVADKPDASTLTVQYLGDISSDSVIQISASGGTPLGPVPDVTPPTPPVVAASSTSHTSIALTWTASVDPSVPSEITSGLAYYKILRGVSALNLLQIAQIAAPGASYTDIGLSQNATYYYAVAAADNAGNSVQSAVVSAATPLPPPDSVAPSTPSNLVAFPYSSTQMDLSWAASTDNVGVAGYYVYRNGTQVGQVTSGVTSYQLPGLSPSTSYSFSVAAFDSAGIVSAQTPAVSASTPAQDYITGGLTAYPATIPGPNLLTNGGFEQVPITEWRNPSISNLDSAVAHSGSYSYKFTDANSSSVTPQINQNPVLLNKGYYSFGGWIKLQDLVDPNNANVGVRMCLFLQPPGEDWSWTCTSTVKGTADWTYYDFIKIVVEQDNTNAYMSLQYYGKPPGTVWFDDVYLWRDQLPLDVYMLYPNYRGILFSDQSQVARFDVSAMAPAGGGMLSEYTITGAVKDEITSQTVRQSSFAATSHNVVSFDLAGLDSSRSYLVSFAMSRNDPAATFTYPAYRVAMKPGSARASMRFSFDQHNRILFNGKPTFLLGVYDSGMDYFAAEQRYISQWNNLRRLFELPMNVYYNYWWGGADNQYMLPMLNALQNHSIRYFQCNNCFDEKTITQMGDYWFPRSSDSAVLERAAHPAFAGFYNADECRPNLASSVFASYPRMKYLNPDGLVWDALNSAPMPWRDTADLLSMDPYPMFNGDPYDFSQVADWTKKTKDAVMGSKPIATVIQFFKGFSIDRWPTRAELRGMSYMAIAEGADGLWYWSLGANALAWICDGSSPYYSPQGSESWCQAKIDNFNNLKAVMAELDSLLPALSSIDMPDLLAGNSNPAIRTRVKFVNGTGYVISYNYMNSTQATTFLWSQPPASVAVYSEARTITPLASSFSDSFGPYETHVYVISTNPMQRRMTIDLEGAADKTANMTAFFLDNTGTILDAITVVTDSSGQTLFTVPPGLTSADIKISLQGYLSRTVRNPDLTTPSLISIAIPKLLAGDINGDDVVNSLDFSFVNRNWLSSFAAADYNKDGVINILDFSLLANNWQRSGE